MEFLQHQKSERRMLISKNCVKKAVSDCDDEVVTSGDKGYVYLRQRLEEVLIEKSQNEKTQKIVSISIFSSILADRRNTSLKPRSE